MARICEEQDFLLVWTQVVEVSYLVPYLFEFLIVRFLWHFDFATAKATKGSDSIVFSLQMLIFKLGLLRFAPILVLRVSVYVHDDTFEEHFLWLLLFLLVLVDLEIRFDHLFFFWVFLK